MSKPMTPTGNRLQSGIRLRADVADVRIHDLRHTVGTFAGQIGGNAFIVRDLLRHKGIAMTERYVNRDVDPVRALRCSELAL